MLPFGIVVLISPLTTLFLNLASELVSNICIFSGIGDESEFLTAVTGNEYPFRPYKTFQFLRIKNVFSITLLGFNKTYCLLGSSPIHSLL